ncbi:MAG: phosphoribosylamine--glycine ligase [Clostridia bacterium]|nr:phosphoribosylamine--glycine ligase [Clostridia bacterium]
MNILVVGGGGREYAIIKKLSGSPRAGKLYAAPGNGGIAAMAECVPLKATNLDGICAWAEENKPDLVVVAPDDPLAAGLVDRLEEIGITAFGPHANAAIVESSKAFSKGFMEKYGIPTASCRVFDDAEKAKQYVLEKGAPIVIKADGLALGKGVTVAATIEQALDAVESMMKAKAFGSSGERVVIEECLFGPEVSVLAFTDGENVLPMVSAQDHKRAFDGDEGPNTGGMGAFSPSRYYTPEIAKICMERIFLPTVKGLKAEGRTFKGVIYFGLMLTADGPKVIEYNARFGDPETQCVLPRLESDLLEIFLACIKGGLDKIDIRWSDKACACVVLASGGYPTSYKSGYEIFGIDEAEAEGAVVCHAGTKLADGKYLTAGGRVLGVTAMGDDLKDAVANAYSAAKHISFENMHFRTDIGVK